MHLIHKKVSYSWMGLVRSSAGLFLMFITFGCGTYIMRNPDAPDIPVYPATVMDCDLIQASVTDGRFRLCGFKTDLDDSRPLGHIWGRPIALVLCLIDLPISLAVDTTILPIDIIQSTILPLIPPKYILAEVVDVIDGDHLIVLNSNGNDRQGIRLEGIDCPELLQEYGDKAKQFTYNMVFGKYVLYKVKEKTPNGVCIATVIIDEDNNLNIELVKAGLAWHDQQHSNDEVLAKAEAEARATKVGIWSRPDPIPPWEFRQKQ